MRQHLVAALGLAAVVGGSGLLWAQEGGGQNGNDRQPREQRQGGDRGPGGDRGDWRERMTERMKEQLDVSDEEWGVLQPKVEKVMEAQRASRMGFGGRGGFGGGPGGGGPGGPGGPGGQADTPLAKASADLRETLDKENATTDEINKKLEAVREARKQAEADLKTAREDLRSLLTPRQEAALVVVGMLD